VSFLVDVGWWLKFAPAGRTRTRGRSQQQQQQEEEQQEEFQEEEQQQEAKGAARIFVLPTRTKRLCLPTPSTDLPAYHALLTD